MDVQRQRERHQALAAMISGATTPGEKEAAQNAMDKHEARYGKPPPGPKLLERPIIIGKSQWFNQGSLSDELHAARAPDGKQVLMSCITTRKEQRCSGCWEIFPRRSRMWRAIAYNGNYRMNRFCVDCFAPDPKGKPQIEENNGER